MGVFCPYFDSNGSRKRALFRRFLQLRKLVFYYYLILSVFVVQTPSLTFCLLFF